MQQASSAGVAGDRDKVERQVAALQASVHNLEMAHAAQAGGVANTSGFKQDVENAVLALGDAVQGMQSRLNAMSVIVADATGRSQQAHGIAYQTQSTCRSLSAKARIGASHAPIILRCLLAAHLYRCCVPTQTRRQMLAV